MGQISHTAMVILIAYSSRRLCETIIINGMEWAVIGIADQEVGHELVHRYVSASINGSEKKDHRKINEGVNRELNP
jgi:hypothetical protein